MVGLLIHCSLLLRKSRNTSLVFSFCTHLLQITAMQLKFSWQGGKVLMTWQQILLCNLFVPSHLACCCWSIESMHCHQNAIENSKWTTNQPFEIPFNWWIEKHSLFFTSRSWKVVPLIWWNSLLGQHSFISMLFSEQIFDLEEHNFTYTSTFVTYTTPFVLNCARKCQREILCDGFAFNEEVSTNNCLLGTNQTTQGFAHGWTKYKLQ